MNRFSAEEKESCCPMAHVRHLFSFRFAVGHEAFCVRYFVRAKDKRRSCKVQKYSFFGWIRLSAFPHIFSSILAVKLKPCPLSVFHAHAHVQMQVVREARSNSHPSLHDLVDAHSSAKQPISPFSIFSFLLFLSLFPTRSLVRALSLSAHTSSPCTNHQSQPVIQSPGVLRRANVRLLLQAKRVFPLGRAERSSNTWTKAR